MLSIILSFERIADASGSGNAATGPHLAGSGGGGAANATGGGGNPNTILMDTRGNVNLKLTVSATNLDKKDFGIFGKSDPYFILSREAVPRIYRSETVRKNLTPSWEPANVSLINFCGGDDTVPISVQVHDWDGASQDDLIGECTFTMREVVSMIANPSLDTLEIHAATGKGFRKPLVNKEYMPGGNEPKKGYEASKRKSGIFVINALEVQDAHEEEPGAEGSYDWTHDNPFTDVQADTVEISLQYWWCELKHAAGLGADDGTMKRKMATAAAWLKGTIAGAWQWKDGDFISVTDCEAHEDDHGPLWVKVSKEAFEAGTLKWPATLAPEPAYNVWYEFRYYRTGARTVKGYSDFHFKAPDAPGGVVGGVVNLDGLDLDFDQKVSKQEFTLIASFLDVEASDAAAMFADVVAVVSRTNPGDPTLDPATVGTHGGVKIPLRTFIQALGLALNDIDGLHAMVDAVKKAGQFLAQYDTEKDAERTRLEQEAAAAAAAAAEHERVQREEERERARIAAEHAAAAERKRARIAAAGAEQERVRREHAAAAAAAAAADAREYVRIEQEAAAAAAAAAAAERERLSREQEAAAERERVRLAAEHARNRAAAKERLRIRQQEEAAREAALAAAAAAAAERKRKAGGGASPALPIMTRDTSHIAVKATIDRVTAHLERKKIPFEQAWGLIEQDQIPMSDREANDVIARYSNDQAGFLADIQKYAIDPPLLNSTAGLSACTERCKAEVQAIIAKCKADGTKYVDPDWNPNTTEGELNMLYVNGKDPCFDCTVGKPTLWKRLTEGLAGTTPQLFKDGIGCGDIKQGQIGTCWLLAAIAAVAGNKHSDRLEKLFCEYDIDVGVYGIRFCIDGEWTYIIVDDQFPTSASGRDLLYAKSANDREEVWVPVLEKAFCKLYTNYEMCDGGQAAGALVGFFGGVADWFRPSKRDMTEPTGFFKRIVDAHNRGWIMSASFAPKQGEAGRGGGKCGEDLLSCGLIGGHAYSVINVVEVGSLSLICCRNPWAQGEWTGKYSDANRHGEWTPELKRACNWTGDANDGLFWISAEDFVKNVRGVNYARSFGVAWKKVTQWHHFASGKMTATALCDFTPEPKNAVGTSKEISFKEGEVIKIVRISAGKGWRSGINSSGEEGYVRAQMLAIDPERPCARYDLSSTHTSKTDCVITLTQKNVHLARKFHYDNDKKMNVKDTSYADMNIYVIDKWGRMVAKRNGASQCLWFEMELDPHDRYRIYCISKTGVGAEFSLRVYSKGRGETHLTGDGEGKFAEFAKVLYKCP